MLTVATRQRPAMLASTSSSPIRRDSSRKRRLSSPVRPMVRASRKPETDSDSLTRLARSASWFWRRPEIRRRVRPVRRLSQASAGTAATLKQASFQSSANSAAITASIVVALDTIVPAALVTTLSIAPTSLAIRDCSSPARVRVKNASDIRCTCS